MKMKGKKVSSGEVVSLSELAATSIAKIIQINSENLLVRKRLFEMGITKGTEIEIKKLAPLGDPVVCCVRGVELCLRKSELKNIIAKVVK